MLITISDADPRPIYRQIMDEIRRGLVVGALAQDDGLPSIRRLAVELRENPNTVKQAYRELEREGVVYVRRGQGTFVSGVKKNPDERKGLHRAVARRALLDAHRNGLSAGQLVQAIRGEAARAGAIGSEKRQEVDR